MQIGEVRKLLLDRKLSVVAAATGITRETLRRIRDGVTPNPSYATVEKLRAYFGAQA